ncbi:TPA: hypothetical protein QDA82_005360 [Burkholderia vietnamiensis]|nr:hypothetical protein [Burkholderia vietnamiensis]
MEIFQSMLDQQLDSMEIDESLPVNIIADDQSWDLMKILRKSLPSLRNELAHGSSMLTHQVLGTIELVAEILSQLYSLDAGATISEIGKAQQQSV